MKTAPNKWLVWGLFGALGLLVFSRTSKGRAMFDKIAEVIAKHEGLRLEPYKDPGAGAWTIGYGHLIVAGDPYWPSGSVRSITKEQAVDLLRSDTAKATSAVSLLVKVPLTENQKAALISLVFNIGNGAFAGSSLLKALNASNYTQAANEFLRWKFDNGKLIPGLLKRREQERALFLAA